MIYTTVEQSALESLNRMDAEYFQPKYLLLQKRLKRGKYKNLAELCEFIRNGPAGSALPASSYKTSGIKVYRPKNLNYWTCDNGSIVYVSRAYCQKKQLKLYSSGDILITRIGNVKFGIIQEESPDKPTISPNVIVIRTRKQLLDPYFLLTFLNTKLGIEQIRQRQKTASLASVATADIANLQMLALPLERQIKIGKFVKEGLEKEREAKKIYFQAENILLQKIGFQKNEKGQLSTILNFLRFGEAKRADAEYFLSKKLVNHDKIKTVKLGEIARVFRGVDPGRKAYREEGELFLRVSNITAYGLWEKSQKYIDDDLYKGLYKKYQPQTGEILLVKDGKPGVACVLNKSIAGIIAEGIVRLQLTTGMDAAYVCLCINSAFCREQIRADIDGSLVPHWKVERIKKLRIPIAEDHVQKKIVRLMKKVNLLLQKRENDLLSAKQLMNVLIESNF